MTEPGSYSCGHPKTQLNSYSRGDGSRRCATCTRASQADYRRRVVAGELKPRSGEKTHCPKGHPYDEENTRILSNGWRQCRACNRENNRVQREAGYFRKWALLRKYGMTRAEYSDLLVSQDGLCAICYTESATQVDHDHESGRVRGLLCGKCNKALGLLNDDLELTRLAADYLEGALV